MAVRHRLRRQLRALTRFLDPLSAAAIRPGAPLLALEEAEAALQVGPWRLAQLAMCMSLLLLHPGAASVVHTCLLNPTATLMLSFPTDAAAVAAV